jgi:polysaccharide biosynthesis/export protein
MGVRWRSIGLIQANHMKLTAFKLTGLLSSMLFLYSCTSYKDLTKNAVYFQNTSDSLLKASSVDYTSRIQKGDILYIAVNTANEESSKLFNQQNFYAGSTTPTGAATSSNAVGYLVDDRGQISFPFVGNINVAGLSKTAFADTLTNRVRQYVSDAIVSVRVLNYKITVLGEVTRPGSYSIPSERVSVLDALGLAGDLTIFGRRDNVKIIREVNGQRSIGELNLAKGNIFSSPYYYLQQNDVVYVELNDRKMKNVDQANMRNVSIALGVISAVALIVTTITNL